MGDVFVVGAATTRFGRGGWAAADLAYEAATGAVVDARLATRDVGAVFVACRGTGPLPRTEAGSIRLALSRCGLGRVQGEHAEQLSASGARALHLAWRAVESGLYDIVLCVGAERVPSSPAPGEAEALMDRAEAARRYMSASGATVEHLARATAKNRAHGARNPIVAAPGAVEVRAVLDSGVLAAPLTRLMVAPRMTGAAAVVLASAPARRRFATHAPKVRASVLLAATRPALDGDGDGDEGRAAVLAYAAAGLGPEDVDFAEIQDETAAAELAAYEALQIVPRGHGPDLIDSGFTRLGGVLPVNTSGGLLSLGELDGASGVAQICELFGQLGGRAGVRQVPGARAGLAQSRGPGEGGGRVVALAVLTAT